MYASVRTLLSGILDYAGTFPPANLPLDLALRKFGESFQEPEAWMLGRFVCPAENLLEIVPLVQEVTLPDRTITMAVLGRGGKDVPSFFKNIETDLADMQAFAGACPGLVVLSTYEVKLPQPLFDPIKANQIGAAIATLSFLIDKAGIPVRPFVEVPSPHRENMQAALLALGEDQDSMEAKSRQMVPPCGLKLRTGGLEPGLFPTPELLAAVLVGCRKSRVPFKATAGLHHPFRRQQAEVQAKTHGFVNVFIAGCLSHAHDLPVADIQAALEDEDPKDFVLDEGGITWRSHRLSNEQIAQGRGFFTSFGSCSFDDPREDLRAFGWL